MVTVKTEPEMVYSKQNIKMAINRNINQKRNIAPSMDGFNRNTVLVNNLSGSQRSVISNGRTMVSNTKNINIPNNDLLRCKRKINFIPGQSYPGSQPASVARRNARERNRVKQVNNGFATLRSHIPPAVAAALTTEKSTSRSSSASKKLSKVETLKMAVEYIRSLQEMLDDHNSALEKVSIDQSIYNKRFEVDESYYSSSPESSSQTVVSCSTGDGVQQYSDSPERVFPKSEPIDSEYYPTRRIYAKSEPAGEVFVKSEIYRPKLDNFNQEIHDTLTSEFYHARSPVKTYYASPERSPNENYRSFEEKNYENLGEITIIPDKMDYVNHEVSDNTSSPGKVSDFRHYSRSPEGNLTILNTVPSSQVLQFTGHSFIQPRIQHRNSTSLSPTMSDACPSPTPSYSSDHSSVHPSSIVSSSSGHLTSRLSRLSTGIIQNESYTNQLSSPALRPSSPGMINNLTPPRNPSPNSGVVTTVISGSSSPTTQTNYTNNLEFQKGSPDAYENYEPMSPEDEELLDVISWWQQSH